MDSGCPCFVTVGKFQTTLGLYSRDNNEHLVKIKHIKNPALCLAYTRYSVNEIICHINSGSDILVL